MHNTKALLSKSFYIWLPFAALAAFACLISYVLVQQDIRQNGNDPQIQIAEDVSQALSSGAVSPGDIIPAGQTVDMATSLDSFVIIYDQSGAVLASSGLLNDATPALPSGVIADVQRSGEDRFTWQPELGVRIAAVVDSVPPVASSGPEFVLAGRSLREVEVRESDIQDLAALAGLAGWIVMYFVIYGAMLMYEKKEKKI